MNQPSTSRGPRPPRQLFGELDQILGEIDEALEEDAETFVREFVQVGGNGGSEVVAFIQAWIEALGPQRAADLLELVETLNLRQHWSYELLRLRYGDRTAEYWLEIRDELRSAVANVAAQHLRTARHELDESNSQQAQAARRKRLISEVSIRSAERRGDFVKAREALVLAVDADPQGAVGLLEEYQHLNAANASELRDPTSELYQIQQLHRTVKNALAPIGYVPVIDDSIDVLTPKSPESRELGRRSASEFSDRSVTNISPQVSGSTLEEATVELLRQLFRLSEDDAESVAATIQRQSSGYQFGHDIRFTAPTVSNDLVQCHVECKNYRERIRTADIADKLLQQQSAARRAPIDHWILVSPHSDASNDLAQMLREWEAEPYWDFNVQIWSPASGVRELFALAPDVYRAIYNDTPPHVNTSAVISEFRRRIMPRQRIHSGLMAYLRDPWRMCFPTEDADHFASLLTDHVELGTIDVAGRAIDQSLAKVVGTWLQSESPATLLLLGEFGDGKSFFTYRLCREFAQRFLDDPHNSWFPVRLTLRDLRQTGSAESLIDKWLRSIDVPAIDWHELAAKYPTLLVLDAFDEMSAELDPPTISANLRLLTEALESIAGPTTARNRNRKALVTSRGRFFDQPREEAALREMLEKPAIVRLRPQISGRPVAPGVK